MLNPFFLRNLLVILTSFSPLVAVFIAPVKQFNSKKAFLISQAFIFGFFLYVLFFLPYLSTKTIPTILSIYPLSLFMFNLILVRKFGVSEFSKVFSVSIMLAFVLTEIHELPAFLYSFFNLSFLDPGQLIFSLAPVYALMIFLLAARSFHLSLSAREKLFLLVAVLGISVFYLINPLVDINGVPTVWAYLKRFYCFVVLAALFYLKGAPGG